MELNLSTSRYHGHIIALTGWRDVGKTSTCLRIIELFLLNNLQVKGVLSLGRFLDSKKTGIQAVDLFSGETRLLASIFPDEMDGKSVGRWTFDWDVLTWQNECLSRSEYADLVVIDELGFLEFDEKRGLTAGFEILNKKLYHVAVVVIRPEFIDAFKNKGFNSAKIETINGLNIDDVAVRVFSCV